MRLLIDINGSQHEVEVERFAPSATLADLVTDAAGAIPPADALIYGMAETVRKYKAACA